MKRKNSGILKLIPITVLCFVCSCAPRIDETRLRGNVRVYYYDAEHEEEKVFDQDGSMLFVEGTIPNGIIRELYPSGTIRTEWQYKDGKRNGLKKEYYPNEKLKAIWCYKNDLLHGMSKTFYENGSIHSEWSNKNGRKSGKGRSYYQNGQIFMEAYFKNDRPHGFHRWYYEDGHVQAQWRYKQGLLEGISTLCDAQGIKEMELSYKQGLLEGLSRKYFPDGSIAEESEFKNNKLDGETIIYYTHGSIGAIKRFEAGKEVETIRYDESGKRIKEEKRSAEKSDILPAHDEGTWFTVEHIMDIVRSSFESADEFMVMEKYDMEERIADWPFKVGSAVSLKNAVDIGKELGVDYLVTGEIIKIYDTQIMVISIMSVEEERMICEEKRKLFGIESSRDTIYDMVYDIAWRLTSDDIFTQKNSIAAVEFKVR